MSIIRAPRPQSNFYLLDKKISEDRRLSWAARGVLIFLLGKPDHWVVSTQHLINETSDSAKPLGRDAVRGLLAELIGAGYLRRVLARADGGKLGGYDYEVCEQWAQPEPEKPGPVQPAPEKPAPANPPLVRTDSKQELIGKQGQKRASAPVLCPDGVSVQTWADFVQQRRSLKAPLTQTALDGIAKQAAKAGWTLEEALAECCSRGWRGFKAEWVQNQQAAGRNAGAVVDTQARNAAAKRMLGFGERE